MTKDKGSGSIHQCHLLTPADKFGRPPDGEAPQLTMSSTSSEAGEELDDTQIKEEPMEVDVSKVKTEPEEEGSTIENNNSVPTLTALLNQPSIVQERATSGKEKYMKSLNLKLTEMCLPVEVVRVKVDLDGDCNMELSIDEDPPATVKEVEDAVESCAERAEKNNEANKNPNEGERLKRVLLRRTDSLETADESQEKSDASDDAEIEMSALSKKEKLNIKPYFPKSAKKKSTKSDDGDNESQDCYQEIQKKALSSKDKESQNDDSDTKKYTCLRCGFITALDEELRHHMLYSHESELGVEVPRQIRKKMTTKYYPCDKCDQVFPTPRLLHYHKAEHVKVKVFTCGKCDQAFASFDILQKHQFEDQGGCLNAYRFSSEPEQKSDKDKKSSAQGYPSVSIENSKSVNESTGENTFICPHFLSCGFKTVESEKLVEHMKSQHSESERPPFTCDVCDYRDYQYANFVAHRKQHLGLGASSKVVCKTVWIPPQAPADLSVVEFNAEKDSADDLSRSSDSSSVEPPPSPTIPQKLKLLKEKISSDSDITLLEPSPAKLKKPPAKPKEPPLLVDKSLSCERCDYTAPSPRQLQRHTKAHHPVSPGVKPYSCMRCVTASFRDSAALRKHMKKHDDVEGAWKKIDLKRKLVTIQGALEPNLDGETDPLSGPPVPIPPECQALLDAELQRESDKLVNTQVTSSEENSQDSGMSFPCDDCQTVFPSFICLRNHRIMKHKAKVQLSCTKCKYKTKDEVLLKRHYLKRHASSALPKQPKKPPNKAASLVRMVSAGNKAAADSTTLDDIEEQKT